MDEIRFRAVCTHVHFVRDIEILLFLIFFFILLLCLIKKKKLGFIEIPKEVPDYERPAVIPGRGKKGS